MDGEPTYLYRLANTGHSSRRYGPCEVCGGRVSEMHLQVEAQEFDDGPGRESSWTHYECNSFFGHRSCLIKSRRGIILIQDRDDFVRTGRLRPFKIKGQDPDRPKPRP